MTNNFVVAWEDEDGINTLQVSVETPSADYTLLNVAKSAAESRVESGDKGNELDVAESGDDIVDAMQSAGYEIVDTMLCDSWGTDLYAKVTK